MAPFFFFPLLDTAMRFTGLQSSETSKLPHRMSSGQWCNQRRLSKVSSQGHQAFLDLMGPPSTGIKERLLCTI